MGESVLRKCLFLPRSASEIWAVPKNCLAEIVTLYRVDETPPETVVWRGREVPVVDAGRGAQTPWRDPRARTGLIAILLGIDGTGCEYLGVPLRGVGLGLYEVPEEEVEDCPGEALPGSTGAFTWRGVTYQVPDLLALLAGFGAAGPAVDGERTQSA